MADHAALVEQVEPEAAERFAAGRHCHEAAPYPDTYRDGAGIEIGLLEIEADIVGELHQMRVGILDILVGHDLTWRSEIGIGKSAHIARFGRCHCDLARFGQCHL